MPLSRRRALFGLLAAPAVVAGASLMPGPKPTVSRSALLRELSEPQDWRMDAVKLRNAIYTRGGEVRYLGEGHSHAHPD